MEEEHHQIKNKQKQPQNYLKNVLRHLMEEKEN